MFKWLNRKPTPTLPEISELTIGRTVKVDPLTLKMWPSDCLIAAPKNAMSIVAQGHCDLGEQSHLHRFYPDDDSVLLQIQGGDGREDTRIDEIMLWSYYDVQYPSTQVQWDEFGKRIKQTSYRLPCEDGELLYERAWFDSSSQPEDPMSYWESVYSDRQMTDKKAIFQSAMLFARRLSDGEDEMLLVNMEEPEGGERCVTHMVGRALTKHSLII
ncbi:DUF2491 family protein [Flexibacterium corallicola]|uniref:DUF2491 family protein n=1 Tax=Flexibacterium corallicola TaxID=3037259 RepID=UPI00286EFEAC|nr:DUF2491 family protein [Pseudovibrio sp. M1P-2-3]